jgi:hypothetical protein
MWAAGSSIPGRLVPAKAGIVLPGVGLLYYKARMYSPLLGRFLQTDPIGTAGGMNVYGYVGGDPVNASDPWGLCLVPDYSSTDADGTINWHYREVSCGFDTVPGGGGISGPDFGGFVFAAFTPYGDTKGDNPKYSGQDKRINTSLPGGLEDAKLVFAGLTRLTSETGVDNGPFINSLILARTTPNGDLQLRMGIDYSKGKGVFGRPPVGMSPRIDIKPFTFELKRLETIHFTGGKGKMCPH